MLGEREEREERSEEERREEVKTRRRRRRGSKEKGIKERDEDHVRTKAEEVGEEVSTRK